MEIYLVGGAVRDELLNRRVTERDWVVVGSTPQAMLKRGYTQVGKDFPVFLHPETKEEYALARTERKAGKGYTGFVCYAAPDVTLEDDLLRRDLTINAMAKDNEGRIIDPYHGLDDLNARYLRHVSDAFKEDPLRVFRVARFAARYAYLGFRVHPATSQLMQDMASTGELAELTAERVWKETVRALDEQSPGVYFSTLSDAHALDDWFGELKPHLSDITVNLDNATNQRALGVIRWALVCAPLSHESTLALCQRLKAPNKYTELAELVSRYQGKFTADNTAEDWLSLFNHCDAWRRPERFIDFLSAVALLSNEDNANETATNLREALTQASKLSAAQFVEQGLKGPEIGAAMDKARAAVLHSVL